MALGEEIELAEKKLDPQNLTLCTAWEAPLGAGFGPTGQPVPWGHAPFREGRGPSSFPGITSKENQENLDFLE